MAVFDVVSDHSDHHYAYKKHDQISSTAKKAIMHEWRILEQNLPETIHVRAYETRIDLLRAVIVGVEGTPYDHGLFFFDIKFPNDYPNHPPLFHYISHGLNPNPNLYKNGKVCLTLLNTFRGSGSEKWDPSRSTIFQVLLSIQALVLNNDPVFNDPVNEFVMWLFDLLRLKRNWSREYNDEAFIDTCRSALYAIRSPPRNFEGFVAEHFRGNGRRILKACDEFKRCGYYSSAAKKTMERLYPYMVNAFEENEARIVNGFDGVEGELVMGYVKNEARLGRKNPTGASTLATTVSSIFEISVLLVGLWSCWYFIRIVYSILRYNFG